MSTPKPPLVMLVATPGGHLTQLKLIAPCFDSFERRWVSTDHASVDVGDDPLVLAHGPTTRSVVNLLRNALVAWREIRSSQPDLIVSTGAGLAVPFFVFGRLLGVRTVFLEVYDRIDTRTLTGRLVRPFCSEFLVQWPEQREVYGGGTVVGAVY
jgi:hypothetical protein